MAVDGLGQGRPNGGAVSDLALFCAHVRVPALVGVSTTFTRQE